ncbi:MAG: hypothetical protein KAU95_02880 [Candidatus Aenigmarchaeota archaeon]|nr:hypothetical protein [Candidatus Aenigmarchaeota archaeon]
MKTEEVIGLLAILCAILVIGFVMEIEQITLIILLVVGGLLFFVLYTKNTYAIFGMVALISALLFYLMHQTENLLPLTLPENYLPTIILIIIVIVGLVIAYNLSKQA